MSQDQQQQDKSQSPAQQISFKELLEKVPPGRTASVESLAKRKSTSTGAVYYQLQRELSARLRRWRLGCELRRMGSLSHIFRKQGIHIIADPVTEVVADAAYFIESDD